MEIKLASISDIDSWMNLVKKVKDDFPGLETEKALNEHIQVTRIATEQRAKTFSML